MEGGEGRGCSVRTAAAELVEALSIEEVRSAHFQGAGRKDRGRSSAVTTVLRDPRSDSLQASFQALSVIEFGALAQRTPCLLFGMLESGGGSDW
jgi:hypothetical protein